MTTAANADATLRAALRHWGQDHVLSQLDTRYALAQQLLYFESWYPGGLDRYLRTATRLYHGENNDTESSNAFDAWIPTIPRDDYGLLSLDAPALRELQAVGLQHAGDCAFVVVAGGLGERLGYDGIKLSLPVETATRTSYLQLYAEHILALEHATRATIPLAIMTSDATHAATLAFLQSHKFFGLAPTQVTLLKQDTVPCLDAVQVKDKMALQLVLNDGTQTLAMKPHGHGDVHTLLHTSGLARAWVRDHGMKFVHFVQDTNALILESALPLLGASVRNQWKWAFTVVPRKAKDASGAIVQFTDPLNAQRTALLNVEYHELDAFLRTKAGDAFRDGDKNDPATGFSPFPGNINHFVADLESYVSVLETSHGLTPEIFNPKYRGDASRRFKSPARLECMMQDFPKLLVTQAATASSTGFLSFPASLVYSPCKNDMTSAAAKVASDIPPQCACSAEHEYLALNKAKLQSIGVSCGEDTSIANSQSEWLGIPVPPSARGPHFVHSPCFGISLEALARRFPTPSRVSITPRSTLIVQGRGAHSVTFHSLQLDGALWITACEGAVVDVRGLEVSNAGFEYAEPNTNAVNAMRGYRLHTRDVMELTFSVPGRYIVEANGHVTTAGAGFL